MTNALPIAQHLMASSRNQVLMPGGVLYREQSIMLSSFQNDVTQHFWARWMFMSCAGIGPLGIHENDPLLVRAEEKLMARADELVILADASKFEGRSSLVLCPLDRVHTVITDERVTDRAAAMIEAADVRLVTVPVPDIGEEADAASA
jgi:DeoR family ulaG and ulaABCDEF operon transcriptional repressor